MQYSVLMSVYKKEKPDFLKQSVKSMFDQTVPTNDFVLICDGPLTNRLDDAIAEMEKEYGNKLRVIRLKKNNGLGYCLKTGVLECKNNLIARMDSDDISRKDRCEIEMNYLCEHPDVSVVGSLVEDFRVTIKDVESARKVPESNDEIIKHAKHRNPINHPSAMFRKQDVLAVGNYPEVRKCQDWYLWTNLLVKGYKMHNIQDVLVYMREDETTFKRRSGWQYFKTQKDLFKKMREYKFITASQYVSNISMRFCSAMMPNRVRQMIFKTFMREKVE